MSKNPVSTRLAVFDTLDSAYIAKGVLEENGINCSLLNGIISSVYPLGWASPELLVSENDAAEARKLLIEGDMGKYLI